MAHNKHQCVTLIVTFKDCWRLCVLALPMQTTLFVSLPSKLAEEPTKHQSLVADCKQRAQIHTGVSDEWMKPDQWLLIIIFSNKNRLTADQTTSGHVFGHKRVESRDFSKKVEGGKNICSTSSSVTHRHTHMHTQNQALGFVPSLPTSGTYCVCFSPFCCCFFIYAFFFLCQREWRELTFNKFFSHEPK